MANRRLPQSRIKIAKILLVIGAPAFILSVALQYGPLIAVSFILCFIGVLLGKNRNVCPSCGKPHLSIAVEVLRCYSCGAAYIETPTQDDHVA